MKTSKLAALTSGIVMFVAVLLPASAAIDCTFCHHRYAECRAYGGTVWECSPVYYQCLRDVGCEIP